MNLPMQRPAGDIMESVIAQGDLARLRPDQRNAYYLHVCASMGLNPATRPFEYITLNGKLVLYAKRDAADQLRKINGVSIEIVSQSARDGLLTVHVRARDASGRSDEDFGAVAFHEKLQGEARANAILKAVTKAKRRVTLSICGLGFLDETEIDDIPPSARRPAPPAPNVMLPPHDPQTGVVAEPDARDLSDMADGGESADSEMRVAFVASIKRHIEAATDADELSRWWKSEEQRKARRDFGLLDEEVAELVAIVTARHKALAQP